MDFWLPACGLRTACVVVVVVDVVVVVVVLVVLVHSVQLISISYCLKAPLSTEPPHANKSLLSLFDFANANQSLTAKREVGLQPTRRELGTNTGWTWPAANGTEANDETIDVVRGWWTRASWKKKNLYYYYYYYCRQWFFLMTKLLIH